MVRGAILVAMVVAVGCGKSGGKKIKRDRDAGPPVEAIDRSKPVTLAATDEREPNNSDAEASPLPLAHLVRGTIDGETDVDVYRVKVGGTGQLRVAVNGLDGVDLALELRDGTGAVLARSDRGPAKTIEGFPGFGVTKGDYLIQVKEFVKARAKKKEPKKKPAKGKKDPKLAPDAGVPVGRVGASPVYELSVELIEQAAELHEIEPDDDTGTAVEVLLADSVRGWIGWSGDVDLWKLALEGVATQYGVDIEVTGIDGVVLTVEVLDAGGERILSRKGAKGGPVMIKSVVPALGDGVPPWHFVKVAGDRSNPESTYDLRFTTRLLDLDEETEPNDDAKRATPLRIDGKATSGAMRGSYAAGDVDGYLLEAQTEPMLLDVTVEPPSGVDMELTVSAGGQVIRAHGTAGAGQKERMTGTTLPAGEAIVITVKAKSSKADTGEARPYRLTWSIVPGTGDLPMPPEEPPEGPGEEMPPEDGDGEGEAGEGDDSAEPARMPE